MDVWSKMIKKSGLCLKNEQQIAHTHALAASHQTVCVCVSGTVCLTRGRNVNVFLFKAHCGSLSRDMNITKEQAPKLEQVTKHGPISLTFRKRHQEQRYLKVR